jgi:hypothetical protein
MKRDTKFVKCFADWEISYIFAYIWELEVSLRTAYKTEKLKAESGSVIKKILK